MRIRLLQLCLTVLSIIFFSSCRSFTPSYDYKELAKASVRLGIDIDQKDNHRLYIEASKWIGVPYRHGGKSQNGTDCSGLTGQIYKRVYDTTLERSSEEQRIKNCRRVSRSNLREGDLVFFSGSESKKRANHAGIYLKKNLFIHASTSRGVIISSLDETYYHKNWLGGGRVK